MIEVIVDTGVVLDCTILGCVGNLPHLQAFVSICADILTLSIKVGDMVPMNPCEKCTCTNTTEAGRHQYEIKCLPVPCDTHCPLVRLISFPFLNSYIHSL